MPFSQFQSLPIIESSQINFLQKKNNPSLNSFQLETLFFFSPGQANYSNPKYHNTHPHTVLTHKTIPTCPTQTILLLNHSLLASFLVTKML